MAAVNVTTADGNTNRINSGTRVNVRTSSGIPYVLVHHATANDLRIYKGNSSTPTSFSGQDTSNEPTVSSTNDGVVAAAIDSSDIIHTITFFNSGKNSTVRYATFDTSSDTWSTSTTIFDVGDDSAVDPFVGVAIDSNDIPHIVWVDGVANMGTDYDTVYYANRVGGSWNTQVEVRGATASVNANTPSIEIDADNIPFIALGDDAPSTRVFEGNANNATSFTNFTSVTNGSITTSVAVDSSGNHYMVSELSSPSNLRIHKHNYGDAWSTWQTAQTIVSSTTNPNVSLAIDGTDLYVFVEDGSSNDIGYYKSTNYTSWDSLVTLETGTYNNVKTKWSFWVDNDSGGVVSGVMDSNSSVDNAGYSVYGGGPREAVGQSFTGDGNTIGGVSLRLSKAGSPTGNITVGIYAHTGTFGSSGTPTGSLLASGTYDITNVTTGTIDHYIPLSYTTSNGTNYFVTVAYTGGDSSNLLSVRYISTGGHAGNLATYNGSSWTAQSGQDVSPFAIVTKNAATELDYTFTDETASPDILWNTLSLGAPAPTTHGEGYFIITS